MKFRVWPQDADLNLHLNNTRYYRLFDLGRQQFHLSTISLGPGKGRPPSFVIGRNHTEFRRELPLFGSFTLETDLVFWDGKWLYLRQQIQRHGEICAVSFTRLLLTRTSGAKSLERQLDEQFSGQDAPVSGLPLCLME